MKNVVIENNHRCQLPDTIDFGGWPCPDCGQLWSPEEIEPGCFSWMEVEDEEI